MGAVKIHGVAGNTPPGRFLLQTHAPCYPDTAWAFTFRGCTELTMCQFNVLHDDHDVSQDQMYFIQGYLKKQKDGFFIVEIDLPVAYGTVPCALYGPACGDEPVSEDEVFYAHRGLDRDWEDRMVHRPMRPTSTIQVIGVREGDKFTIFTVYGGPLAPQHPEDPSNLNPVAAGEFWADHALATGEDLA